MNVCVIGGGVSGLALAKLLGKDYNVTVLERSSNIGGIARTKQVSGCTYHVLGGHCFNSKNSEVLDFVFSEILPKSEWHLVERKAEIYFKGKYISYPIEYAVKEIYKDDKKLAFKIVTDFFNATEREGSTLAEWFRGKFGNTLAEEYFIPYNKKIWGMNPIDMSPSWVEGKLPIPNKMDFFDSLLENKKDCMPHSYFYYPNSNDQNTFLEALARGVNVNTGVNVSRIKKTESGWIVNDEIKCDLLVSTIPLDQLPKIIDGVPCDVVARAGLLKCNCVTNMLWSSEETAATWTYYPSGDTLFHRHIHIGNFFSPRKNFIITECVGEVSREKMITEGRKFSHLKEPLAYSVSDYAYVVYDHNYQEAVGTIKNYLSGLGIYTLGRFGEWEYYNMDVCIEKAMHLAKRIRK